MSLCNTYISIAFTGFFIFFIALYYLQTVLHCFDLWIRPVNRDKYRYFALNTTVPVAISYYPSTFADFLIIKKKYKKTRIGLMYIIYTCCCTILCILYCNMHSTKSVQPNPLTACSIGATTRSVEKFNGFACSILSSPPAPRRPSAVRLPPSAPSPVWSARTGGATAGAHDHAAAARSDVGEGRRTARLPLFNTKTITTTVLPAATT